MSSQCSAWRGSGGDGRTGLIATGKTAPTPDVTTWPCVVTEKAFEGAAGLPSRAQRVSGTEVGGTVSRADTGLIAQCYIVAGMAFPRELVKQRRDAIPGRVRVVARVLRCQSIKCPYTGAGTWMTCVQVPSSDVDLAQGGVEPSSEVDLARVGVEPQARDARSGEADLARGGAELSSEADLARGGVEASSEAGSARGSVCPSSEEDPARGGIRRATLAGCGVHQDCDRVVCVL
jgi:hypothetical protein